MTIRVTSSRRGLLRRELCVTIDGVDHEVIWDGRGMGYETLRVDGVSTQHPSDLWFRPRFRFEVGGRPAALEVRVAPWFSVRRFVLHVDGVLVHTERPIPPTRF